MFGLSYATVLDKVAKPLTYFVKIDEEKIKKNTRMY